jgi:hypothetical protein
MTRHNSRHIGNKFPVLLLTPKSRSKRNLREYGRNLPVPAASHFLCHSLSKADLAKFSKSTGGSGPSKQHLSMPHVVPVRPQSCYPRAPREPESTLFQPQLYLSIVCYTFANIRMSPMR